MEKMEEVLRQWQQMPPEAIEISSLRTMEALQPRDERLVPFKDRYRVGKASDEHVTRLHLALQRGRNAELEPLLVAKLDDGFYVVDGHHRLKAYKRAGRPTAPARVKGITKRGAVIASKLVNSGGAKLAMTPEQSRDACWQYVAHLTNRGVVECPLSARELAGLFGVGKDTALAMIHRVKEIKASDFSPSACDPGTGWPRWRYVKLAVAKPQIELDDPEKHRRWRTEKDARKLADLFAKIGKERFDAAMAFLMQEAEELVGGDSMDVLRRWSALQEPVAY